jgi:polysaccharide biosynthesis/export protein
MNFALLLLLLALSNSSPQAAADTAGRDYLIGPGDNLLISVSGLKEFEQSIRVSNSGRIHVRYAGVLTVSQMTPGQVESEIGRRLRDQQVLKDPWVQVRVSEYRAHPVYILGEVMQPGQFLLKDEMYVADLVSLAAGFNEVASPVGYLYRRKDAGAESRDLVGAPATQTDEAIAIDFKQLYDGTRPELNLRLQAGDVLYVPQRRDELFFIAGDVFKPGVFRLNSGEQLVATQAISRAGGPLKTAKMSKGILVRYDAAGARQELPIDFRAILAGRKTDVVLKPNDIIFIPGSTAKTLGYGLLGIVPGLAHGAILIR